MGSIEDLFALFTNGFWSILQSGSAVGDTGSTVAEGVYGQAIGSVGNIISGPAA